MGAVTIWVATARMTQVPETSVMPGSAGLSVQYGDPEETSAATSPEGAASGLFPPPPQPVPHAIAVAPSKRREGLTVRTDALSHMALHNSIMRRTHSTLWPGTPAVELTASASRTT